MTVEELAKELAKHIAKGGGKHQVAIFQWHEESQPVTELVHRPGLDFLEFYSGSIPTQPTIAQAPADSDEFDDLI